MGTLEGIVSRATGFLIEAVMWAVAPILIVLVLAGIGAWLVRAPSPELVLPTAATAGALVVVAAVAMANLVSPVPRTTVLYVVPIGLLSLIAWWRLHGPSRSDTLRLLPWLMIPAALYRLGRRSLTYDVFLYQGGIVEWLGQEPTPLGLGLLHSRFAFNPALPVLMAPFRSTGSDWNHHVLLETAVVMIASAFMGALLIEARRRSEAALLGLLVALATLSGIFLLFRDTRVGTDLAAGMTVLAAVALAAGILHRGPSEPRRVRTDAFAALGLVVVFAILQKTSSALAVLLLLAPFIRSQNSSSSRMNLEWRRLIAPVGVAAAAGIAMLVRTWVMSGCFVYPVSFTCADGPSRLGPRAAADESAVILSWARSGSMDHLALTDLSWLRAWFGELPASVGLRVATFAFLVGVVVRAVRHSFGGRRLEPSPRLLWVFAASAIGFWFVAGPDPRFGFPGVLVLGALVLAPAFAVDEIRPSRARPFVETWVSFGAAGVIALTVLLGGGRYFPFSGAVAHPFVSAVLPGPEGDREVGWEYVFPSGSDQCGDAFPCAPGELDVSVERVGERLVFRRVP